MSLLSLSYASVRKYEAVVLQEISLDIQPNEQWAVVGNNGSGKSTLLEILGGKWPVWRGTLRHAWQPQSLHKIATLVPTDYSFHRLVKQGAQYYQQRYYSQDAETVATVREVLTDQLRPLGTVNSASVQLNPMAIDEASLRDVCALFSIEHLLDKPFVTLSNGETRRMVLAWSLLKNPRILLLDNPFAGLDTHSREVLRGALTHLKEQGVTVVLSTSSAELPPSVTHVLQLEAGKIVWQGQKEDFVVNVEPKHADGFSQLPALFTSPRPIQLPADRPVVALRSINVRYGEKQVLDNVVWQIKKGEKWALTGPNGSGKSTLLSILTADHPQRFANDYDLFGQKRGGVSMWDVKKQIGHVSPELHLYFPQETTVFKAIASGFFDATGVYFRKLDAAQTQAVHELAAWFGVSDWLEKPFKNFSKGQQRLLLLARALVKNPPLLILDEPCQGLDFATVEHFKSVVNTVCDTRERTLIYVSHYPHEIPSCVTQTLRLDAGKVVEG